MALPSSVAEIGTRWGDLQAAYVADALGLLEQALRRGRSSPEAWRAAVQSIGDRLLLIQVGTATYADAYLNDLLEAQNADGASQGSVYPQGFADLTDGGGSWLQGLVYAPNSVRDTHQDWWSRFSFVAQSIVKTGLGDTARAATQSAMQARPAVRSYVRMLRGKSCARCAILAGRVYHARVAFKRHKRCDCLNVPAAEDADDWRTDPKDYFRSLTPAEQDKTFGVGGAEAIRLGADMSQVVNAESGVTTVSAYGRELQVTTTGTTVRALFGGYEVLEDGTLRRRPGAELSRRQGQRYRSAAEFRLMPDQIFQLSEEFGWDRAEVLRQLRRFAYIV